jgi:hypothetical protein
MYCGLRIIISLRRLHNVNYKYCIKLSIVTYSVFELRTTQLSMVSIGVDQKKSFTNVYKFCTEVVWPLVHIQKELISDFNYFF